MPLYYSTNRVTTTNGTANTCSTNMAIVAATLYQTARLTAVLVNARNSTAGGGELRIAGTVAGGNSNAQPDLGAAATIVRKRDDSPAAVTSVLIDSSVIGTNGTTQEHTSIGFAETGGQNGWVALEPDDAFLLRPTRGCQRFNSYAVGTSQNISITLHFNE